MLSSRIGDKAVLEPSSVDGSWRAKLLTSHLTAVVREAAAAIIAVAVNKSVNLDGFVRPSVKQSICQFDSLIKKPHTIDTVVDRFVVFVGYYRHYMRQIWKYKSSNSHAVHGEPGRQSLQSTTCIQQAHQWFDQKVSKSAD